MMKSKINLRVKHVALGVTMACIVIGFGFFIAGAWATGHTSSACVGTGVALVILGGVSLFFAALVFSDV